MKPINRRKKRIRRCRPESLSFRGERWRLENDPTGSDWLAGHERASHFCPSALRIVKRTILKPLGLHRWCGGRHRLFDLARPSASTWSVELWWPSARKRSDACWPPKWLLCFQPLRRYQMNWEGSALRYQRLGWTRWFRRMKKEEQKLRSTKYETTFTLLHRLLRYEGAYGRLGTSDGRELSHSGAVGWGMQRHKSCFFSALQSVRFWRKKTHLWRWWPRP